MALDRQNIPIAFGQGIDTKSDPKQLVPGKLTVLQNGIFDVGSEINKRNGFDALTKTISSSGTIAAGVSVQTFNDELTELDGTSLYSYNSGVPNWINKGSLVTTSLATKNIIRDNKAQTVPDSAINGNYQCFVWHQTGTQYSIIDRTTGQSVINNQDLDTTGYPAKVIAIGNYFVVFYWVNSAGGLLKYKTINIATPTTLSSATTIASDAASSALFDCAVNGTNIVIAYASTTSDRITLYYLSSTLVLSSALNVSAKTPTDSITVFVDASNRNWVAFDYFDSPNYKLYALVANAALNAVTLAYTLVESLGKEVLNVTGVVSGTIATLYYQVNTAAPTNVTGQSFNIIKTNTLTLGGTAGTAATVQRGAGLASKAFVYSGVTYFWIAFQSSLQNTYFLINSSAIVVAKLSPGLGGGYTTRANLPEVNVISSGVYQSASLVKDQLIAESGTAYTQTGVLSSEVTFETGNPSKFVLGNNLHIAGGLIQMYDGGNVVEHGYNVYPENLYVASSTSGGALGITDLGTTTNQYQYCAVFEWTDNQGQLHRSAPSVPITLSLNKYNPVAYTGTFSGTSPTYNTVIVSDSSNIKVGQYVNFLGGNYFTPNSTVSSISSGTLTVSSSNTPNGILAGNSGTATFYVTNYPIGYCGDGTATAGSNIITGYDPLTASGLAVGQKIYNYKWAVTGLPDSGVFASGTYITAIDATTITLSEPALRTQTRPQFYPGLFYTFQTLSGTITVPTLRLTQKANVSIALYRTELNQTLFYRVTSPTSLTYNDKTNDTVTITDAVGDDILIGNEQLYTTGEIENIEAPAITVAMTNKSRAVVVPAENQLSWWYSKQVLPGKPVEFSDSFVKNIDSKIVRISAVGTLDEKFIFFGPSVKFFVVGDGPSASGANDDFSQAQRITGVTGCTNQASLVEVPVGLLYQDPTKGIYLLDRSLQEVYIGVDVEAYSDDPVTSAQVVPETTTVKFTLESGTVLLYDWYYNQWGTDPFPSEAISSTVFQSTFVYVQANGLVLQETPSEYTDNNSYFALSLTTGWMGFAGVQGFQRVYQLEIVGNYFSPHTLNVEIYTDFDDVTPTQTVAIPVTEDPGKYQFRIRLSRQKCEAIKLKIYDSNQSGTGQSFSLSSMAFEVGVKRGLNKLSAEKSF